MSTLPHHQSFFLFLYKLGMVDHNSIIYVSSLYTHARVYTYVFTWPVSLALQMINVADDVTKQSSFSFARRKVQEQSLSGTLSAGDHDTHRTL
jgi:hypothetical protein